MKKSESAKKMAMVMYGGYLLNGKQDNLYNAISYLKTAQRFQKIGK